MSYTYPLSPGYHSDVRTEIKCSLCENNCSKSYTVKEKQVKCRAKVYREPFSQEEYDKSENFSYEPRSIKMIYFVCDYCQRECKDLWLEDLRFED